jgi:hypothetical protein
MDREFQSAPLDAEIGHRAWQLAAPLAPIAAKLTVFGNGPSGLLTDDADDEARLVDVTGRRSPAPHANTIETVTQ